MPSMKGRVHQDGLKGPLVIIFYWGKRTKAVDYLQSLKLGLDPGQRVYFSISRFHYWIQRAKFHGRGKAGPALSSNHSEWATDTPIEFQWIDHKDL